MGKRTLVFFAVALAVVSLAAGCGSGGGDSTGGAALTKAEFIKRADAICQKSNAVEVAKLKALDDSNGSGEPSLSEQLRVVILPAVRKEAEEIGDLVPPAADRDEVDAMVTAYEQALTEGERDISSLLDGSSDKFSKAFLLAQKYGFKVCGVS